MRLRRCHRGADVPNWTLIYVALMIAIAALGRSASAGIETPLHLEVFINGNPTNLVATFRSSATSKLSATAAELRELGLKVPQAAAPSDVIFLDQMSGVAHRYVAEEQVLHLTVEIAALATNRYDGSPPSDQIWAAQVSPGLLLNYGLFGSLSSDLDKSVLSFNGGSAFLDARVFGEYGTFSTSGIARAFGNYDNDFLRLETTWSYSDQARLLTYRVGDTTSAGLAWTRPIRMAGVQMQRDFSLRPDLITMPLPSMSGTSVVPSTVDVFINSAKVFSQDIPAGPFEISNIPMITGAGIADVIVRDASGRETRTSAPIYASSKLLRPGIYEFSSEVGFARQEYGLSSNTYSDSLLFSASGRYGIYDWMTVEGHAELAPDLLNLGFGYSMPMGTWALSSAAASVSAHEGEFGGQAYLALEFQLGKLNGRLSTQRTSGLYSDLGTVTAEAEFSDQIWPLTRSWTRPPRAIDQLSLNVPLLFDDTRLGLNLTHLKRHGDESNFILSGVYARQLFERVSMLSTGFIDLSGHGSAGLYLGLSMPLGGGTATATVSHDRGGVGYGIEHVKTRGSAEGDVGWQLRALEGKSPQLMAAVNYRAAHADLHGRVLSLDRSVSATAELQGSIVSLGGGIFFAPPISDAFAVVDAKAPDVDVFYQNRHVTTTNRDGRALVTGLNAYQPTKIRIDPLKLPIDAELGDTEQTIVPADRSGVLIKFDVRETSSSALIIFRLLDRSFAPVGVRGRVDGQADDFVVGYDGQAFLTNLSMTNLVTLHIESGPCHALFDFSPVTGQLVTIDPVICQ